ncbi:hypothetical protein BHM03_00030282 [Ensete ventricosum]|uniref:Uncharacterized protein n=1 Tax=Ensete ventricosum TaxID=4639 RepID=A0A445MI83_ENSVE|nr:hypothetical protein BHM03_00030282 [Ensete ventricosum]
MFEGVAPADPGTADALVVMWPNFDVDSTVMTRRLVEVRKNYFILSEYELHVPLSGERPYDAFSKGFNLSPDALEAGLGFPLHPMIEVCLKGWQISPSQMTLNSWRYLVAFLWECFGSGITVTRDLFMACFHLSRGQAGNYLTAHAGFRVGVRLPTIKAGSHDFSSSHVIGAGASQPSGLLGWGVKDMNEAWVAEVGLSPAPQGMFLLSAHCVKCFTDHTLFRRKTTEYQAEASGSSTRVPSRKGKEPVAMEEAPKRGYILRELCEVEDCVEAERYFATVMARLKVAEVGMSDRGCLFNSGDRQLAEVGNGR